MKRRSVFIALAAVALAVFAAVVCIRLRAARAEARRIAAREEIYRGMGIRSSGAEDFVPLPRETPHRSGAALVGAVLFSDKRLVKSSKRTCAACHPPLGGGTDNEIHSGFLTRSTQNAAFSSCFMHDGRISELKDVVEEMISSPGLGSYSVTGAVERLSRDRSLAARFAANYETGLVASNMVDAIVQYLRANVTRAGAFDRYLQGEKNALDAVKLRGFGVFKSASCIACHSGPALGGRVISAGRKVTPLRGISKRKVFLSDGSAPDVSTALFRMPTAELSDENRASLVAFLECL